MTDDVEVVRPCKYCGMPATTVDHVVPQSLLRTQALATVGVIDWRQMIHARFLTVPACNDCNSALGNRVYPTIEDRKAAVKRRLRRKYRRLLKTPAWKDSELEELGPGMRGFVARQRSLREDIERRLAW